MVRKQFTFYESFADAIFRIKKKSDRLAALEAVVRYALYETSIDPDELPGSAASVFLLIRPILDAGRRKAVSGKKGGETPAGAETPAKQTGSKNKKESEPKIKRESENKNESYKPLLSPAGERVPFGREARKAYGVHGRVLLTQTEYDRLGLEMGPTCRRLCIVDQDEQAGKEGERVFRGEADLRAYYTHHLAALRREARQIEESAGRPAAGPGRP